MPDEILTLPEVALLIKVAKKTVYTMAQKSRRPNHFLAAGFTQRLVARCTKERGQ